MPIPAYYSGAPFHNEQVLVRRPLSHDHDEAVHELRVQRLMSLKFLSRVVQLAVLRDELRGLCIDCVGARAVADHAVFRDFGVELWL